MPLSEDEQRILKEIEANLNETDPRLVQEVSETTLYRHSARAIKWAVFGFVAGLALLLFTFTRVLLLQWRLAPAPPLVAVYGLLPPRLRAARAGCPKPTPLVAPLPQRHPAGIPVAPVEVSFSLTE